MAEIKFNFYNVFNSYYKNINKSVFFYDCTIHYGSSNFTILLNDKFIFNKLTLYKDYVYFSHDKKRIKFYINSFYKKPYYNSYFLTTFRKNTLHNNLILFSIVKF